MSPYIPIGISLILLAVVGFIQQRQIKRLDETVDFLGERLSVEQEYTDARFKALKGEPQRPVEWSLGWLNDPELHLKVERKEDGEND